MSIKTLNDQFMKEIIEDIIETTFNIKKISKYSSEMDGYIIKTNQRQIKLGISNKSACCENWGYFSTEDNLNDFIGAELFSVRLTDSGLNTKLLDDLGIIEDVAIFITLETNKGTFQFTVYNDHNGYYAHEVYIQIGESIEITSL